MSPKRGSLSLGSRLIRRELRSQPAVVASLTIAVFLSTFVIGAAPRLLEKVAADDLYATVSEPLPSQRNIRVERAGRYGTGPNSDPFSPVRQVGDSFAESSFPPSVLSVVSGHYFVVESPQFTVSPLPGEDPPHPFPTFVRFRYQEHIEDNSSLVEGSLPMSREPVPTLEGVECPDSEPDRQDLQRRLQAGESFDGDCQLIDVPHYEMAITADTASAMGLGVGSTVILRPDSTDPQYFGLSVQDLSFEIMLTISGIVELSDESEEYWFGDPTLHNPNIQENADLRIIYARGLMSPDDYRSLASTLGEARWAYTWRYFVSPEAVRDSDVETLQSDLATLQLDYPQATARATDLVVLTRLPDLLSAHLEQRKETIALMAIGAAGLFGVVVVVSLLMALLLTERQRTAIVLTRNRGASLPQLSLTRVYEGLIIVAPAAFLGYVAGRMVLPATENLGPYRATVSIATAVILAVVVAALPLFRARLGSLQTERAAVATSGARRVVFEVVVLTLAVVGTLLVRRRGEIQEASTGGPDLFLAFMPAIVGLAAGLVTLRIYPYFVRILAWLGSLRRGAVWFVGFRRILQQPWVQRLPVLVLLMCTAMAAFASITRESIRATQEATSWEIVGADYSVKGFGANVTLPSSIVLDDLADPDSIGLARSYATARVATPEGTYSTELIAVSEEYDRITLDGPLDRRLPESLRRPAAGTLDDPIPAMLSSTWPGGFHPDMGDVIQLDLGGLRPFVEIAEMRPSYPDLPPGRPFIVLDLASLEEMSDLPLPPTVAYIRGDRTSQEALADQVASQAPSARVTSRYDVLDSIARDPFILWVDRGLTLVFWLCVLFAVASAVAALALSASVRRRDLGYLRTLGLRRSQAAWITSIEQGPPLIVGVLAGLVTGVGIAVALAPAVDLGDFTGNLVSSTTEIDWVSLAWVGGALFLSMTLAVVVSVWMSSKDDPGRLLRIGDE